MKKRKIAAKNVVRQIAKSNAHVGQRVVLESIDFVNFARKLGSNSERFGILPSSESTLKIKAPILHRMG
jgi:hypothetical protein